MLRNRTVLGSSRIHAVRSGLLLGRLWGRSLGCEGFRFVRFRLGCPGRRHWHVGWDGLDIGTRLPGRRPWRVGWGHRYISRDDGFRDQGGGILSRHVASLLTARSGVPPAVIGAAEIMPRSELSSLECWTVDAIGFTTCQCSMMRVPRGGALLREVHAVVTRIQQQENMPTKNKPRRSGHPTPFQIPQRCGRSPKTRYTRTRGDRDSCARLGCRHPPCERNLRDDISNSLTNSTGNITPVGPRRC